MDLKTLSDEELVVLAQNKNNQAFSEIIERYKNLIKTIIRPYFLIGGDFEDLMQEGMIAVFNAVNSFNGKASFRNYVCRCIKNSAISMIRRYNSDGNLAISNYIPLVGLTDGDDKNLMIIDISKNPETTLINDESDKEFVNKLKEFLSPLEYRIVLLFLQGYSYKEISEQTGKTEKSIDNALQRTKRKVAELYK